MRLEIIEDWQAGRVAVLGCVPWVTSFLLGIIWSACDSDMQTAFTVASFVLTAGSSKSWTFQGEILRDNLLTYWQVFWLY